MAGSVHRQDAEALRMQSVPRRGVATAANTSGAPSGFAQLLNAVEFDVSVKAPLADAGTRKNEASTDAKEGASEERTDQSNQQDDGGDRATERSDAQGRDVAAGPVAALATDEVDSVEFSSGPVAVDADGVELAPETVVEADAAAPVDADVEVQSPLAKPEVAKVLAEGGSKAGAQAQGTSAPSEVDGEVALNSGADFVSADADASPDKPSSDTAVKVVAEDAPNVGESVDASLEAAPELDIEAPADQAPKTLDDVNLTDEFQAESLASSDELLGLDGADLSVVDGPDAIAAPSQSTSATQSGTVGASAVIAGATAVASTGDAGGQQSGSQGQSNNAGASAELAASRAANRNQSAQRPQFSKLMQDRQIEVVRQISKQIGLRSAAQADSRISMLLNPESLGAVRLDLQFEDDGSLSIDANVDESVARRLIASAVEELRTSLKAEGVQLNRLTVTEQSPTGTATAGGNGLFGGDSANNSSASQSGNRGRTRGSAFAATTATGGRDAKETQAERAKPGRLGLGDVDLTA